ncbi:MAG: UDP-N-acetylmuramate--alanine ligase, partial [Sphingomonadales bacterium]
MSDSKRYFLSGIGGSGMLSLAILLRDQGHEVAGSDRARDQGRSADKFAWLEGQGVTLFPQDGSGIVSTDQIVVASAAVEDTVPDMAKTKALGAKRLTRAQLLAKLFNAAPQSIAIGGTSGKSTTTGMAGWIAHGVGLDPTIMNGAVMNNFARADAPFISAVGGKGGLFISEVDESDGSIVDFHATVAVINNIAFDHKTMEELREIFATFLGQAGACVLNADDAETMALAKRVGPDRALTFSLRNHDADFFADAIRPRPDGISFSAGVKATGKLIPIDLKVPGRHNV